MLTQSVLVRGIRWRLAGSVLTLLAATLAFAAAVVAPLYLRAAQDSVVRSAMAGTPPPSAGVSLGPGLSPVDLAQMGAAEVRVVDAGGQHRWYGAPITSVLSGVDVGEYHGTIYARTAVCANLQLRSGSCDLGEGDVLLSNRTAKLLHVGLGDAVGVSTRHSAAPIPLTVVGIYAIPNLQAPYWWREGPGIFDLGTVQNHRVSLDPFVSSPATATAVPPQDPPTVSGQVPLFPGRIDLSNESRFLDDLAAARSDVKSSDAVVSATEAPQVLAQAAHDRRVMSTIVVTVAVQLLLLALWVLAGLVVRSSEARQAEIRLARLRGFPWRSVVGVIAAEPGVLCLAALPIGAFVAWAAVLVARSSLFFAGTAVRTDGWLWVSIGATLLGIMGALAVGTARVYRSSTLVEVAAGGQARRHLAWRERAGVIADVVVLMLCGAALAELIARGAFAGGKADPLAAVGPGLVALAAAVIAAQTVAVVARLLIRATVQSRRVATFLTVRQVVRRPVLLRQGRVLVVALCLACFASASWSLARFNRARLSEFEVGAAQVVTVTLPAGQDPVETVDETDPAGRWAMASAVVATSSSTVLAVDARRLARVASWPSGISSASAREVSAMLSPHVSPQVTLTGQDLGVRVLTEGAAAAPGAGDVHLDAWLYNVRDTDTSLVDLGAVRSGLSDYTAALGPDCLTVCRLTGVGLVPGPSTAAALFTSGQTTLVVTGLQVQEPAGRWEPLPADLAGSQWSSSMAGVSVTTTAAGPRIEIGAPALAAFAAGATSQSAPMAGPAVVPGTLPAVVTSTLSSINGGGAAGSTVAVQGLDGATLSLRPVNTALTLPRVGTDATLVDLSLLERAQTAPTVLNTTYQVWLGATAPHDAIVRLERAGLKVETVQRAATLQHQLDTSGPALADDFLLLATGAALLVAAISTLAALAATARQRAIELSALRVAGVSRRSARRSLFGESATLAVTALFGTLAGVVAAAVAIPSLPELANVPAAAPPLQYPTPVGLIAAVSAAAALTVLVAGMLANGVMARRSAERLARIGLR